MIFESVRVKNFKSIKDSGDIHLKKMTLLAGKNNAGKTSVLEAVYKGLNGQFVNHPDDSNSYLGNLGIQQNSPVEIEIVLQLKPEEKTEYLGGIPNVHLVRNQLRVKLKAWQGKIFLQGLQEEVPNGDKPSYILDWGQTHQFGSTYGWMITDRVNGSTSYLPFNPPHAFNIYVFIDLLSQNVIYVNGNRTVIPSQSINFNEPKLNNQATNLYSAFHVLHNNQEQAFNKVREAFISIFPDVTNLFTPIIAGNHTVIELSFEHITERITLRNCGSGFTHVLIVLYLLYAQENENRLILFDEPQSFLHPLAEKAIYKQIADHSNHKFIFTTHSPILINYPADKNLYLVTKQQGISQFSKVGDLQVAFKEIGAVNSDFALSDKVLFVEGPTEKNVIPLILSHFGMPQIGYNYSLISLKGTGDEFKNKSLMVRNADMYEELFKGISQNPIDYRILLDRDEKKAELIRRSYNDRVILLERRELENYFLDVDAISAVIQAVLKNYGIENEELHDIVEEELANHLENKSDRKLYPDKEQQDGIVDVVGSEVLERIFQNFHIRYNKPYHGTLFVEWLLENNPAVFDDVAALLNSFLNNSKQIVAVAVM